MNSDPRRTLTVLKLGGSVLTNLPAYTRAAAFLSDEAAKPSAPRLVAVVSAEHGHTDALAREARQMTGTLDAAAMDLLWATGELRSVALLTLALGAAGVAVAGLNAHETGLRASGNRHELSANVLALRVALARHSVVVVPGFLATLNQQFVTLGRGGSDLSAVMIAVALGASQCVLIKDVDGYFTDDPATHANARRIERLSYVDALAKAEAGCPLVQWQALEASRRAGLPLAVRSVAGTGTIVSHDPHV